MTDADLEEIRRARLQQLQQQQGRPGSGAGGSGGADQAQEEQQKQREAEARSSILNQILEPDASDRLNRIRLVKETRATDVENRLIMLARSGQLRQKVTEAQLKDMLTALSEKKSEGGGGGVGGGGGGSGRIVVSRRKGWDADDDDLLDGI